MSNKNKEIEQLVHVGVVRFTALASGVTGGILVGLGLFIATNLLLLKGGEDVGRHLSLLGQYFIGYKVTFTGSLIGLGYGFISGFVFFFVLTWVYNFVLDLKSKKNHP